MRRQLRGATGIWCLCHLHDVLGDGSTSLVRPHCTCYGNLKRDFGRPADLKITLASGALNISTWQTPNTFLTQGLSVGQAMAIIVVSRFLVSFFSCVIAWCGLTWHIGFTVQNRFTWGLRGAYIPLIQRSLLNFVWSAIQTWNGGKLIAYVADSRLTLTALHTGHADIAAGSSLQHCGLPSDACPTRCQTACLLPHMRWSGSSSFGLYRYPFSSSGPKGSRSHSSSPALAAALQCWQ